MKTWSTGLSATLMAFGLAISLSSLAGCGGKTECSASSDCAEGQVCDADGKCVTPEDKCANTSCPGAQTCDSATGACTGDCCGPNSCNSSLQACDETACAEGKPQAEYCVDKVCPGDGPNRGCADGFSCDTTTWTCEANCVPSRNGCPVANQTCNTETGECELKPTEQGAIGSYCTETSQCNAGLQCWTDFNTCVSGPCNTDSDCASGTICFGGGCTDACEVDRGDCFDGLQCLRLDNDGNGVCLGYFAESKCQTGCLPNGSACDPAQADQCEAGSICNEYTATCTRLGCHLMDGACPADEFCTDIAYGVTGCLSGCDATDPTACSEFANENGTPSCQQQGEIIGPLDVFTEATSADKCPAQSKELTVGTETSYLCYAECTDDSSCHPGQFCGDATLEDNGGTVLATLTTCMNYNVVEGACPAACPNLGCTDLGGFAACYKACTSDADCTDDVGGSCQRFTFGSGAEMDTCIYGTAASRCAMGCESDADCGYCETDADCPKATDVNGTARNQQCDQASHTCQVPLSGPAEVSSWCYQGQVYYDQAIEHADGTFDGSCAYQCKDDLDCGSDVCVDGYCQATAQLCNGPTGQCEALCSDGSTCLFGDCDTGAVDAGGRCVLGCDAGTACEAGVCDETAGYCVNSCVDAGCASGQQCNETSGLCEMLTVSIDTLALGGDEVLTDNAATATADTATALTWATTNADSTALATAAATADCSTVAAGDWTEDTAFPGTASGSYEVTLSADVCVRFTATNVNGDEVVYFGVTLQ